METINQQLAHALELNKELENAENTYYVIKGELDNANKRIKELEERIKELEEQLAKEGK